MSFKVANGERVIGDLLSEFGSELGCVVPQTANHRGCLGRADIRLAGHNGRGDCLRLGHVDPDFNSY